MNGASVADIVKGQLDFTGTTIDTVYSKVSGTYAVYRTSERVVVQYADEPGLGSEQRLALAPLNPIRGEINGLVDGWRGDGQFNTASKQARAKSFDRRTADALTVALQGDQTHAAELLAGVKTDIVEERTSIGRTEYMVVAAVISAIAVVCGYHFAAHETWVAISIGSMGALFSIALAIRSREIRTDLQRRDNIVDAILRIGIGAISAIILFSLLKGGFATIGLGEKPVNMQNLNAMIVIAFVAGFAERMVGDFISTAVLTGGKAVATDISMSRKAVQTDHEEASEQNPLGRSAAAIQTKSIPATDETEHIDQHIDGCLCEIDLNEDDLTDDLELPEATGGVEKA